MSSHPNTENYDFLRRGRSVRNDFGTSPGSLSPRRKPVRNHSTRTSDGTLSTATSNSAISAATNITQPPSFSKKFVVVGDGGCGKTCLLISYSQGYFPEVQFKFPDGNNTANTDHRSTYPRYLRTTSPILPTSPPAKPLSWLYGIQPAKKNMIACDHYHTLRPTCSSYVSPLTALIR